MLHLFSDHSSKGAERAARRRRSVTAALLTAAVAFSMIAAGCGSKNDDASSAAESPDTAVSSSAASKAESSSEASAASSKAESSKAASSKAESSKAASSKAESSKASEVSSKEESQAAESKAETKPEAAQPEESKPAEDSSGYKAGDTVAIYVKFGNISMNGQPAKIGAYDFWLTYDASALEYVSSKEQTKSDLNMVNEKEPGIFKIAHVAALGFDDDYTGEKKPTYKVTFKVKKDTNDLGLSAQVPSLAAVSMDGKSTQVLINKKNPQDMNKYCEYTVEKE